MEWEGALVLKEFGFEFGRLVFRMEFNEKRNSDVA